MQDPNLRRAKLPLEEEHLEEAAAPPGGKALAQTSGSCPRLRLI